MFEGFLGLVLSLKNTFSSFSWGGVRQALSVQYVFIENPEALDEKQNYLVLGRSRQTGRFVDGVADKREILSSR